MSTRPYMKLFASDLIGDTQLLSDAEFGSYVALLLAMWNHKGWLPEDHAKLARAARYRGREWPKRWASLEGFFTISGGRVTNPRMLDDLEDMQRVSSLRATSGAQGGRAKSLKNKNRTLANASTPDTKVIEAPTGPSITSGKAVRSPEGRTALPVDVESALKRDMGEKSFGAWVGKGTFDPETRELRPATMTAYDALRRTYSRELKAAGVTLAEPVLKVIDGGV